MADSGLKINGKPVQGPLASVTATGCLVLIIAFPILSLLIGGGVLIAGVAKLASGNTSDGLPMAFFGGFFALVGGAIFLSFLRKRSRRVRGKVIQATGYEDHPAWLKRKARSDGRHGGETVLRPEVTTGSTVGCLGFLALLINGPVIAVFVGSLGESKTETGAYVAMAIFGLIGLAVLGLFIHAVARMVLVRDPRVLLSMDPLRPGQSCRVRVFQEGSFDIDEASLALTLEESATYTVGTNRRTDRHEVLNEVLASANRLRATAATPLLEGTIALPPDAMHSYKGPNNEIAWSLRVHMVIPGRPDVDMTYLLRVAPVAPPSSVPAAPGPSP